MFGKTVKLKVTKILTINELTKLVQKYYKKISENIPSIVTILQRRGFVQCERILYPKP